MSYEKWIHILKDVYPTSKDFLKEGLYASEWFYACIEMEDISETSIRMKKFIGIDLSHLHFIKFENILH